MKLNSIKPALGAKKKAKRVGRGIGCTDGKTCGRGHKGQHSRSGGYHKVGFEGGQMPLYRRVPKSGFSSRQQESHTELTFNDINKIPEGEVSLATLLEFNVISRKIKTVKIIKSGTIKGKYQFKGCAFTAGAQKAVEEASCDISE